MMRELTGGIYKSGNNITFYRKGGGLCTIYSRNLGATVNYGYGDTLDATNCGNFYQWGNNNGFPWASDATITTSTTLVDASSYGPGNYYSSSTFITPEASPYDWSSVQNDDLWGEITGGFEANQGPCDSGFHIPTSTEMTLLKNMMSNLGVGNVTGYTNYLLFPPSYYLNRSSGTLNTSYGPVRLWTCTMGSYSSSTCFSIDASNAISVATDKPANGFNIRAFKNIPIVPDSSWTVMYQGTGDNGIYRDTVNGLITIIYSGDIITIQDHHVGATVAWEVGDIVNDNNAGLYYQFGNNYGFPHSGATDFYTTTQNVSGYGPGNYYNDSHFVKISSNYWFDTSNNNIWGGTYGSLTGRRGPCSSGYHVPSLEDLNMLHDMMLYMFHTGVNAIDGVQRYLLMPKAKNRGYSDGAVTSSTYGFYSSSSVNGTSMKYFTIQSSTFGVTNGSRGQGYPIRPFRNIPLYPTSSWTPLFEISS